MKRRISVFILAVILAGIAVGGGTVLAQNTNAVKGSRLERHPRIRHAIVALEAAKAELKNAPHDFGGHREAALQQCDAAIAQLKLALQYDKK